MNAYKPKLVRLTVIAGIILILDQLTKMLILANLKLYAEIQIIPGLFNIVHLHNPGGAFGFLATHSLWIRTVIFFVVSIFAIFAVLYFYWTTPPDLKWLSASFALILGGAAGNLVDRIKFGAVVDFLDFYILEHHWPAFNVADSAITIGMSIFLWHVVFGKIPE